MKTGILWLFLGAFLPFSNTSDDVAPLQAVVEQLTQQLTSLQARMTLQDSKMATLETLVRQQNSTISELHADVDTLKSQMALQTPFAAFDVQFADDPRGNVNNHEIMKFDEVITNVGNAYNPHNGMFQAPVSGVYLFHFKVTPYNNGNVYVYLAHEGSNIDSAHAADTSSEETGDSVRIVQLSKGDRVWLLKSNGVTSVRGWAHTKLSGFLLRAT